MSTVNFNVRQDEKDSLDHKVKDMPSSLTETFRAMIPLVLHLEEKSPGWSTRFISHVSSTKTDSLFGDNMPDAVTVAAPVNKRLAEDFAAQVEADGGFQYPAHAIARALLLFSLPAIVTEISQRLQNDTPSAGNVGGGSEILYKHRECYKEAQRAIDELRRKADDASERLEKWDDDFVQAGKKTGGTWAEAVEIMLEHREAEKRMQELYNKPTKKGEKS